jgi:hypothetical protein
VRGSAIDGKAKAWKGIDGHGVLLSFIGCASWDQGWSDARRAIIQVPFSKFFSAD